MSAIRFFNERVKRLNIFDIKLIQGCAIFVALIIVKIIPEILNISIGWFITLLILCAIRPVYIFFIRSGIDSKMT